MRLLRGFAVGLLATALAVGGATAASAHAELEKTDPAVGQTVKQSPGAVNLTFSEDMLALGAIVQVMGPDGAVDKGNPSVSGRTVVQPLDSGVKNGSYIVTWRLTAGDGHVQSGTFTFLVADPAEPLSTAGVGTPPAGEQPPTPEATPSPVPSTVATVAAAAPMVHGDDEHDSLPIGWVVFGFLVLALVIAAAVLTEFRRRRRRRAADPSGRSTG